MIIEFFIPGNPKPKERPRKGQNGFYTPSGTRSYESLVALHARLVMNKKEFTPFDGALEVLLRIYYKLPKSKKSLSTKHISKPDIDNAIKSILDGMNGICYADDKQICDLNVSKRYCSAGDVGVYVKIVQLK